MKVIITRPLEQGVEFANLLKKEEKDFEPVLLPTLELIYNKIPINIDEYDWIVFTSPRGVKGLFKNLDEEGLKKIKEKKIGAIGIETAREFRRTFNMEVDVVPKEYTAESLLESLKGRLSKKDRILLPTTPASRDILPKNLNGDVIHVYYSKEPDNLKYKISMDLKDKLSKEKDRNVVLTFTSALTAKNFFKYVDEEFLNMLKKQYIVSIGPITNRAVGRYGGLKGYIPKEYTIKGMIEVIKYLKK
ncbi:MAG TPA: uroporphyrinogen-III synthase [Methanothermococcus okinawensis]|uniref:Uroporphyrinogen-III synthase n=1 Tax=Methanothermococcus okinawensis TaxID=155863 RepID=A0A832YSA1_9EURY|nr:uroporphyrinogen-III synthase [Methanothermococcus okinawensis]